MSNRGQQPKAQAPFEFKIHKKGNPIRPIDDIYHAILHTSGRRLFLYGSLIYILTNLCFAFLYFAIPNSISTERSLTFADAFFFSVQTMATVGYGTLSPQGLIANIIVTIEAAFGLLLVAVITGLVFARLSRPKVHIIFSDKMVLSNFNGERCLSFRMANARGNDLIEAHVSVTALFNEITEEGERFARVKNLKLKRAQTPFFRLSWSVFHVLDETSPLHGFDLEDDRLRAISITLTGHDGTYATTVYARHNYQSTDIYKDHYFEDVIEQNSLSELTIDYSKFHELKSIH